MPEQQDIIEENSKNNPQQAESGDSVENAGAVIPDEPAPLDLAADELLAELFNAAENGEKEAVPSENSVENSVENSETENDDLPEETAEIDPVNDTQAKIKELEEQLAEAKDQLLRKAADFENFRKRMNQEKQKSIEFANESLLLDIIPVIDDFERAIQSAETSEELKELPAGKAMLDGITMIEKRMVSQLESKWGLKRFNCAGELFDPNRHEAMLMEKSPDVEEPVVQEDFIKGYTLKDRVIRTAKVKVIMPEENKE